MARPDDEESILHYYREHPDAEAFERRLAADPALRARYERLAAELDELSALEPPEPRPGLEGRLWSRVEPELSRRPSFLSLGWPRPRILLAAAAALALVAIGFLAGRLGGPAPEPPVRAAEAGTPIGSEARGRLLESALATHLDASERLLVELANDASPSLDEERRFAQALLASNRLYRRAAERSGQRRIAALLAELEPLLAELANDPADDGEALSTARERLESNDLLFKVRVTRSNI